MFLLFWPGQGSRMGEIGQGRTDRAGKFAEALIWDGKMMPSQPKELWLSDFLECWILSADVWWFVTYHPWPTWPQLMTILYRNAASPQNVETKIESGAMFALPVRIKPKARKGRHLRKSPESVYASLMTWLWKGYGWSFDVDFVSWTCNLWMVLNCSVFSIVFWVSMGDQATYLRMTLNTRLVKTWRKSDVLSVSTSSRRSLKVHWLSILGRLDHVGWKKFDKFVWLNIVPLSNWDGVVSFTSFGTCTDLFADWEAEGRWMETWHSLPMPIALCRSSFLLSRRLEST